MCQLTLVKTNREDLTLPMTFSQMARNSTHLNKDGWGIFTGNKYYKTGQPFSLISALQVTGLKKDSLAIGHVRAASTINGKKVISDQLAHPFVYSHLIGAHNGTLSPTGNMTIPENSTDSQVFLSRLNERLKNGEELVKALISEYQENWEGKFAFLLYKNTAPQEVYAARGFIADLHYSAFSIDGEKAGIIINTEKVSLVDAMGFFQTHFMLSSKKEIAFEDPKNMEAHSIFKVTQDFGVEKVGNLVEKRPVASATTIWTGDELSGVGRQYSTWRGGETQNTEKEVKTFTRGIIPAGQKETVAKDLLSMMDELNLTLEDVNTLALAELDDPLVVLLVPEIQTLIETLQKKFRKAQQVRKWSRIRDQWAFLHNSRYFLESQKSLCDSHNLKFPWWTNTPEEITAAWKSAARNKPEDD